MYTPKQLFERRKRHVGTIILMVLDVLMFIAAFKLAVALRLWVFPRLYEGFPTQFLFTSAMEFWWFFAIWMFFYVYEGLYTENSPYWDDIIKAATASTLATVGVFLVVSVSKLSGNVSRAVIVSMGFLLIFIYPIVRIQIKKILRMAGLLKRRVLILGAGKTGSLILTTMRREPNLGYEVVAFLDDDPRKRGTEIDGIKVRGPISHAERFISGACISDVVIAMPGADGKVHQELINRLQHKTEQILFVPDLFGMAVLGVSVQHFFNEQAIALMLKKNLEHPLNYLVKRVFDYSAGLVLFMLTALPMAVIALLIKLTSPGPAFFLQKRFGKNGRVFKCIKFRTMRVDAEDTLQKILFSNPDAKEEYEKYWKLKDDPRITAIGEFLRRTSLDELPQIINVIKGDMSLIGPRPYIKREWEYIEKHRAILLSVLPGITGLWQVSGRSDTSYDYRIALDSWYVRNWNLWLDIVLLLKTIGVVFKGSGAR